MLVNKYQVESFIPQKSPFVMVDELLVSNQQKSVSQFLITEENILCKEGFFHESGLIENIAQTAALSAGYQAMKKNEAVEKGFIGAVKHLKIYKLPLVGDTLSTSVQVLNNVMNASIIKGEIKINDILIAACELTIFTGQ